VLSSAHHHRAQSFSPDDPHAAQVIVDFSAKWCGPCKMISPFFEQLADKFSGLLFFKVDVDDCQVWPGHSFECLHSSTEPGTHTPSGPRSGRRRRVRCAGDADVPGTHHAN